MSSAGKLRQNIGCLLPFIGVAVGLVYIGVFSIFRLWGVGQAGLPPTSIRPTFLEPLASLRYNLPADTLAQMNDAITLKQSVVWGYGGGLVAVSLLFAILISGYTIWNGPRREVDTQTSHWSSGKRWGLTGILLFASLVAYPLISHLAGGFERFTIIPKQLWGVIRSQLTNQEGLLTFINIEVLIVALGYGVSVALLMASASTLWPLREIATPASSATPVEVENAADHLAMQVKHLRYILYIGAILLVVITFRHKMTLNWALDYTKPLTLLEGNPAYKSASILYGNLDALVSNIVMASSLTNTLLLVGLYVPSALVLQRRAVKLSDVAVRLETEQASSTQEGVDKKPVVAATSELAAKREAWIKSHGLIYPLKEQLPKAIAILSPLLAGPIGELLNFFK